MPVISLLTDFGNKDGFVGTMKGVIWGICPGAQIADISHEITPQNIREGAIAGSAVLPRGQRAHRDGPARLWQAQAPHMVHQDEGDSKGLQRAGDLTGARRGDGGGFSVRQPKPVLQPVRVD